MTSQPTEPGPTRPLHPPLVHTPIGATVTAVVLDVISAVGGGTHPWARDLFRAGTFVLMVGTGVMFAAAFAGLVDRARGTVASTRSRRQVNRHAAVMAALLVLSVVELFLRRGHYADAASTPVAIVVLGLLAFALVTVGGELGGRLTYRRGIGVRAPERDPEPVNSGRPVL